MTDDSGQALSPSALYVHDGWLYFFSGPAHPQGGALCRTNGEQVVRIPFEVEFGSVPSRYASAPEGLFFAGTGLFWTDGNVLERIEIHPGRAGNLAMVTPMDGAVYFYSMVREVTPDGVLIKDAGLFKVVPTNSIKRVDYNRNDVLDAEDIDYLSRQLRRNKPGNVFDLNEDGEFDELDRLVWIQGFAKTSYGDANLDGTFQSGDLVAVWQAGLYEGGIAGNAGWATGDWNGDGGFTSGDLLLAFATGRYEMESPRPAAGVPEPSCWVLLVVSPLWLLVVHRRQR